MIAIRISPRKESNPRTITISVPGSSRGNSTIPLPEAERLYTSFKKLLNTVELKSLELNAKQNEVKRALFFGEEKERKRVAQDLHDGMGSLLSTLRLNAESIDLSNKNLGEKE